MATTPTRYFLEIGGRAFQARHVRGEERMSRPSRFEIDFVLDDGLPLPPDAVVKSEARLRLERDDEPVRVFDGVVTHVAVRAAQRGVQKAKVILESRLALLRHRTDIRVFRDKDAPTIVGEVLSGLGVSFERRLQGTYPVRPYCVQFRESDFDFVNRLLEDEGIHYFFLPGDRMVLGDAPSAYEPVGAPLPFRGGFGMDQSEDALLAVGTAGALGPARVTLRDWTHERPSLDMDTRAETRSPSGAEWYDYPGEYETPEDGARKAKLVAEAFSCAEGWISARTTAGRVMPGGSVAFVETPGGLDGPVVVTRVVHDWIRESGSFSLELEALPASVAFRPPRATPIPTQPNPLTGFVTTPPGADDIHTDAWGRVKVHFPWDRLQPKDDRCSHWVPILQDNTGMSSAIARRGWEVLCYFLEGDPDRPVVAGRVYNVEDTFADKLPDLKTRSAIKSLVTPSRDGTNEIRFDDAPGGQEISIFAEKDENVVVANDHTVVTASLETLKVEGHEKISIGANQKVTVLASDTLNVGGNQTRSVGGSRKSTIGASESVEVTKDRSVSIGGMHFRRIAKTDAVSANNLSEKVGAIILEASLASNGIGSQKIGALTVGGLILEVAPQQRTETANLVRADTVGGAFISKADGDIATRAAKTRKTMTPIWKAKSVEEALISSQEKVSLHAKDLTLEGTQPSLTLKVGETKVVLQDGVISVTSTGEIVMTIDGQNDHSGGRSVII